MLRHRWPSTATIKLTEWNFGLAVPYKEDIDHQNIPAYTACSEFRTKTTLI
jgi:hypothetical protein